jgi:hypothetical protein
VEKLKRIRPSSLLKVQCREVVVRSRREASQVGEATKESRGEIHFSHSVGHTRRNRWSKSSKDISRSFKDH